MKAKDIQIGDYLKYGIKVESITKKKVGYYIKPNECRMHYTRLCECEPIPLTPEVLEKNGFLANKHVYPYPYYEYEVKENKVKVGFAFPQGNKTSYKEPWVYIDSERVFIEHLPCVFVHQLQHAMRLCWIEKEIEL